MLLRKQEDHELEASLYYAFWAAEMAHPGPLHTIIVNCSPREPDALCCSLDSRHVCIHAGERKTHTKKAKRTLKKKLAFDYEREQMVFVLLNLDYHT